MSILHQRYPSSISDSFQSNTVHEEGIHKKDALWKTEGHKDFSQTAG